MKRIGVVLFVVAALYLAGLYRDLLSASFQQLASVLEAGKEQTRALPDQFESDREVTRSVANDAFAQAYASGSSELQLQGEGEVVRILADDHDGNRHQRFIVRLPSGQTLLLAHNIDLAPRVENLVTGDSLEFYGEYEWNSEGGVMHWTHRDPQKQHTGGWIRHKGRTYR